MTKRQKIDASREARLWIAQVIVPAIVTGGTLMAIPEVRNAVATKVRIMKQKIRNKNHKTES